VDKKAVVGAAPRDLRQRSRIAGLARDHLARPAFLRRIKEVHSVFLIVGKDDVEVAVFVDVDEAKAGVAAFLVNEARAGRKLDVDGPVALVSARDCGELEVMIAVAID
jgi:hypothetical protein